MRTAWGKTTAVWMACAALALASCGGDREMVRLATTTSTQDSGLLERLLPVFEKRHGVKVHVIAVGTGKAIKHGENGDVDVIMVHSRAAEDKFVAEGYGVERRDVMHNDFVILGPERDPAAVKGSKNAASSLKRIAAGGAKFVSRGDDSGTHKKEMSLWGAAGVKPAGEWYMAVGQGMGASLTLADEKEAYILADRGTWLKRRKSLKLVVLVEGDPSLFNPYGVIAVNPEKHPEVKHQAAMKFGEWLVSPEAQALIAEFKVDGERLFHPDPAK